NDELTLLKVRADNQIREMNVIYESGFYAFVFKSRKPEAKKFRKWVTSEVLPTIRKHGVYASPQNFTMNAIVSMAQNFIGLEQEVKEIKADVQSLQDTSAFTSNDCRLYLNAVNAKVDGIISQYPDNPRSSIYPQIHNAVKERYQVGSYKDLPHYKIDEVIDFVKTLSIRVRIAK
ncbi:MAG: ORF6C domain-containing protein, partial [Campylobacteraceae bacterium]|nr:ORF6C domain-containing protein [Campylobacteraceae bacterium]